MKKLVLICLCALVLNACNRKKETEENDSKEVFLERINSLECALLKDSTLVLNKQVAGETLSAYTEFAKKFPDDPATPGYLFKAGEVAMGLEKYDQSIGSFEIITTKYPTFEKAPQALFLQAFIYDNSLQDDQKAKVIYEQFIEKYPDHTLTPDAKISLSQIGKSDEDLIKEFDQKIKEQEKNPS